MHLETLPNRVADVIGSKEPGRVSVGSPDEGSDSDEETDVDVSVQPAAGGRSSVSLSLSSVGILL